MPEIGKLVAALEVDATKFQSGLAQAQGNLQSFSNHIAGTAILLAKIGIAAGVAGAGLGLKFAADLEQARIGFTTMLGSATKADAFLRDMGAFAAKTPFEFPELLDASRKLMAFGFEAGDILPMMTDIGDAMAAMGQGSEAVGRITYALGQMSTSGRVGAQDMMQLTSVGVKAWDYLAKASGKSIAEVRKLAEEGMLDARAAIQIILAGMRADYAGAMEAQSKTFSGLMSTMKDTARMGLADIMEPLLVALRDAMAASIVFTETATFREWKENATSAVAAVASTMRDLATAVRSVDPEHISLITQAFILLGGTAVTIKAVNVAVWGLSAAIAVLTAPATLAALAVGATALALWRYPQLPEEFYDPALLAQGGEEYLRMLDKQEEAMRKLGETRRGVGEEMARVSKWELRAEEEDIARFYAKMGKAAAAAQKVIPPLITTGKEAKTAGDRLQEAGFSVQDMASALVAAHPAVQLLNLRLVGMRDQLAGVNAAIEVNATEQRMIQMAISATQERISGLNSALSTAKQRLSDLAAPRLTGMGRLDEQIFQAEQAIKRLQLVMAGGRLPAGIVMPKGGIEQWQKELERLRLLREITYEPMLRQLQAAAQPMAAEIGFGAAMASIRQTHTEIARLEGQLAAENATLAAQQAALRGTQEAGEALRQTAAGLQVQISRVEEQLKFVNDALVKACLWMLEGSKKAKAYGGVITEQALVLDEQTTKLLETFFKFSDEHSSTTIADVNAVTAAWEAAKLRIDEIAADIKLQTAGIGGGVLETRQFGGYIPATGPYLLHRGEYVIPAVQGIGNASSLTINLRGDVYLDGQRVGEVVWDNLKHRRGAGFALGLT